MIPPLHRAIAVLVMVLPFLGAVTAVALAMRDGIGFLEMGLFGTMYALTLFAVTVGFHRHLAHRAFRTTDTMRRLLLATASMAAQGPPLFWVATHRLHHSISDREGDPHSPQLHPSRWSGLLHAHLLWMVRHPGGDVVTWARDLLKDPLVFRINQQYPIWVAAGFLLPALAGWVIAGDPHGALLGLLWGGFVRCFVVQNLVWAIGSICHTFGRRPYRTRDASGNVEWLGPVTFGEAYHNNHHAFPGSAALGLEWWEVDVPAWVIRALERVGLVWDVNVPTPEARRRARERASVEVEGGLGGGPGQTPWA